MQQMQSLDSLGIGSQSGESRHDFPHVGISDVDLLMANGASIIAKALMGQIHDDHPVKELSSNGSAMSKLQENMRRWSGNRGHCVRGSGTIILGHFASLFKLI